MVRNGQKQEESAETFQETNDHTNYGPEEWMSQGAPYIDVQLLTPNEYSRPQLPMNGADYIAIHYTANPGAKTELWRRVMPIPLGEMETNTNWEQNFGY